MLEPGFRSHRQCFAALKRHTRAPWELIVIDNGSTDGTASYLAGVRDMAAVPVTIVSNPTNSGSRRRSIRDCVRAGEYLVLLNNDVVVTDGGSISLLRWRTPRGGRTRRRACRGNGDLRSAQGRVGRPRAPTTGPVATRRPGDWLLWGLPPGPSVTPGAVRGTLCV